MYFLLLIFLFYTVPIFADAPQIIPPSLKKGDLIALVFPASFFDERDGQLILDRKARWLNKQGYRTIIYPTKVRPKGYLSGTDQERARSLMDAWKDGEVKAIWCVRGGWGTPRIMDLLDYDWIKSHPKIFIGMSDITALHHAIQKKTGLVTFLAPVLNYFDESSDFDADYAFAELENVLVKGRTGIVNYPKGLSERGIISPGKAAGKVVGGNLSLIASLCGTPWQLNTAGKILLLEDVGEDVYRIDRMLWQLEQAGLLEKPAGVILAHWENCGSKFKYGLTLNEVFYHYFKDANYPVIKGFPSGHYKFQTTVPLNAIAEIDSEKKFVRLLQPAVQLSP